MTSLRSTVFWLKVQGFELTKVTRFRFGETRTDKAALGDEAVKTPQGFRSSD